MLTMAGGGKSRVRQGKSQALTPLDTWFILVTRHVDTNKMSSDHATVKVISSSPSLSSFSHLHLGAPPVSAPVLSHCSRGTLALSCDYTPSLYLCACFLFFDVCPLRFWLQEITTSFSLPKTTIPIRETAVAVTASTLAGFGVVALFCSVGVYV